MSSDDDSDPLTLFRDSETPQESQTVKDEGAKPAQDKTDDHFPGPELNESAAEDADAEQAQGETENCFSTSEVNEVVEEFVDFYESSRALDSEESHDAAQTEGWLREVLTAAGDLVSSPEVSITVNQAIRTNPSLKRRIANINDAMCEQSRITPGNDMALSATEAEGSMASSSIQAEQATMTLLKSENPEDRSNSYVRSIAGFLWRLLNQIKNACGKMAATWKTVISEAIKDFQTDASCHTASNIIGGAMFVVPIGATCYQGPGSEGAAVPYVTACAMIMMIMLILRRQGRSKKK